MAGASLDARVIPGLYPGKDNGQELIFNLFERKVGLAKLGQHVHRAGARALGVSVAVILGLFQDLVHGIDEELPT